MFLTTWRRHWALEKDPFACEDADKDLVLDEMAESAVHSAFDRVHGDPSSPAPGIVFGEKGSGKSGMRIAMRRRLNALARPAGDRILVSEYVDFDVYLERFRCAVGVAEDPRAVGKAVERRWTLADHLDAMLSLGVTKLVDDLLEGEGTHEDLSRRHKIDLLLLTALYHDSRERTVGEAWDGLTRRLGFRSRSPLAPAALRGFLSLLGVFFLLGPFLARLQEVDVGPGWLWAGAGFFALAFAWLPHLWGKRKLEGLARSVSIRPLARHSDLLARFLGRLSEGERNRFVLPTGTDERQRYDLLERFGSLRRALGYSAWYVLVDRIDEPSALAAHPEGARRFAETILDHKLLQLPGLALKLFLPIEHDRIHRSATPEQLKRMRLDKSNLVETLDWTGQELVEIAGYRIRVCSDPELAGKPRTLWDFFAEDLHQDYVRETLTRLSTPRYMLGFLAHAFREYARNLPGDLHEDDPRWRMPRAHFDMVRDHWLDRTDILRRTLNAA